MPSFFASVRLFAADVFVLHQIEKDLTTCMILAGASAAWAGRKVLLSKELLPPTLVI